MTAPDVFLKDALAESLLSHAGRSTAARELLGMLQDGDPRLEDGSGRPAGSAKRQRVAVRGLTGSSRA